MRNGEVELNCKISSHALRNVTIKTEKKVRLLKRIVANFTALDGPRHALKKRNKCVQNKKQAQICPLFL